MDTAEVCQHCGKPLGAKAVAGLCAECLMKVGLGSGTAADPAAHPPGHPEARRFVPPAPEQLAPHFPQLEILGLLGQGGMGAVYKARQQQLDRIVALKILPTEVSQDPAFAERFTREARALARLSHPHIVTVHDFGLSGGFYYFVMEFIDGVTLRHLLAERKLAPREALAIVPQVCEALQFAHDQGVVHRDIKPENILLDKAGRVKIADFGLAKLMVVAEPAVQEVGRASPNAPSRAAEDDAGALGGPRSSDRRMAPNLTQDQVIGTPYYMAPEQVETPQSVDHRADIYSLGVVFYEMLTGELPLGRFAPPSRKVQVDVRLDEIVLRALEKEPQRRYQQASHVRTDVETISTTTSTPLQETNKTMNATTQKPFWSGLVLGAAGAILALGVCLAVGFAVYLSAARKPAKERADGNPVATPTDAARLTEEGWALWKNRRMVDAAVKFEQAVKLASENTSAWNGLGWASFNLGQKQRAEEAFLKCVELDPNHPAALNGLGQLYLSQKEYDKAEAHLLKAAPKAPAAWHGLARLYLVQGDFEKAEQWASKVVESGQGNGSADQMLQAARDKRVSDSLRLVLEPQ